VTLEDAVQEFAGKQFSDLKARLSDVAVECLAPIQDEYRRLLADKSHVDQILANGAERAGAIAEPVLREVQSTVGFLRPKKR
jgi:tryptophanyl-tRNA synthetase